MNHLRQLPLWQRLAAFLSFLAVVSALIAPASMLAEEVRTGKLGGLCLANTAANGLSGTADEVPSGPHCDLCGSSGVAVLAFVAQPVPSQPTQQIVGLDVPFDLAALVYGLPPNRGPPAL